MTVNNTPPAGPIGLPYTPSPDQPVTEWSEAIYAELKDWPPAANGIWERWEPDYLVLKISSHLGTPVEPIWIDTCEDELTVNFGYWEIHLPDDGIYEDTDSTRAAEAAKILALDWLDGRISTAVYSDRNGKWCGSKLLEQPDDFSILADIEWIKDFGPTEIEVRKSLRSDWRKYQIIDGRLQSAPT
ncbi:hypothetical protein [Brevundimonas diminuta]